jgi:hypothetical protein
VDIIFTKIAITTNTKVLLLVFLALIAFITMPVSAGSDLDFGTNGCSLRITLSDNVGWQCTDYNGWSPQCSPGVMARLNQTVSWHTHWLSGSNCEFCYYDAEAGISHSCYGNMVEGNGDFFVDSTYYGGDTQPLYPSPNWEIHAPPYSEFYSSSQGGSIWINRTEYVFPSPVAAFENVAHPKDCYYPGEYVDFVDESTNTPTSWTWGVYDDDLSINLGSTDQNPGFTMPNEPGDISVILCAENAGGEDCEDKIDYLTIGSPGECTYEPIQNVTVQPTLNNIPVSIPNFINMTAWGNGCRGSALGNATDPYCNAVDDFSNVTNSTFSGIIGIFTLPLDWTANSVSSTHDSIDTIVSPLITQSSIFLGIMTRGFAILPAVLINIVTLGLLIDVVRIVLKGRGGE